MFNKPSSIESIGRTLLETEWNNRDVQHHERKQKGQKQLQEDFVASRSWGPQSTFFLHRRSGGVGGGRHCLGEPVIRYVAVRVESIQEPLPPKKRQRNWGKLAPRKTVYTLYPRSQEKTIGVRQGASCTQRYDAEFKNSRYDTFH